MKVYVVQAYDQDSNPGVHKIFLDYNKAKKYVDDNNIKFELQQLFDKETFWEIRKIQNEFLKQMTTTKEMPKLNVLISEYMDTLNYPEEIKKTNISYCIGKNKANEYKPYEELQMYEMEVDE